MIALLSSFIAHIHIFFSSTYNLHLSQLSIFLSFCILRAHTIIIIASSMRRRVNNNNNARKQLYKPDKSDSEKCIRFVHKKNQSCKSSIEDFVLWINEFLLTKKKRSLSHCYQMNRSQKSITKTYDIIKRRKKCFFIITVCALLILQFPLVNFTQIKLIHDCCRNRPQLNFVKI